MQKPPKRNANKNSKRPVPANAPSAIAKSAPLAGTSLPLFLVGIGASAGGLEALRPLIEKLRPNGKVSYIVAQHLAPQQTSLLTQLLSTTAGITVQTGTDGLPLQADTLYVTPPNHDVYVKDGYLGLRLSTSAHGPIPSIDTLFCSLANEWSDHAVGVLLSGSGRDGSHGSRAISAASGRVLVQIPEQALQASMPQAAINLGVVDLQLDIDAMAEYLNALGEVSHYPVQLQSSFPLQNESLEQPRTPMQHLLEMVFKLTNIDFSQYKEATLRRQIDRRISALRLDSLDAYVRYLTLHGEEILTLQKSFLISVTAFFRDQDSFNILEVAARNLLEDKGRGDTLRVWVPGCATGEEAYSIAMLLAEVIGSRLHELDLRVFATDVDALAIDVARAGLYSEALLENVNASLRERYFQQEGRAFRVSKKIRELCVFARHDIMRDPPFLRMDLISCRNLLIYIRPELQEQLFNKFHYALNPQGYLLLGKSESTSSAANLFSAVDSKNKLYSRKAVPTPHTKHMTGGSLHQELAIRRPKLLPGQMGTKLDRVRDVLLRQYAPASVLVSRTLQPLQFYGNIKRYLQIPENSVDFTLVSMCLPELRADLHTLVYRASQEGLNDCLGRPVHTRIGEDQVVVRVAMRKITLDEHSEESAILVSFEEQPDKQPPPCEKNPAKPTEHADAEVLELRQELAGVREHLQAVIEELETTNEELQLLNEELQSSTEELQASNEELETTNEEMQATNEELTAVNDELEEKSVTLTSLNETLNNLQSSIQIAIIVVDRQQRVTRFNPLAVRVFGLMPSDLGQSIVNVPCYLNLPALQQLLVEVMEKSTTITRRSQRDDFHYLMQISPYLSDNGQCEGAVLTFSDISELHRNETLVRLITDALPPLISYVGPEGRYRFVNRSYQRWMGHEEGDYIGRTMREVVGDEIWLVIQPYVEQVLKGKQVQFEYEIPHPASEVVWVSVIYIPDIDTTGRVNGFVAMVHDITALKRTELELRISAAAFDTQEGIYITDASGVILRINQAFTDISGYTAAEIVGKRPEIWKSGYHNGDFYASMWTQLLRDGRWQGEIWNRRKSGEVFPQLLNITAVKDAHATATHYVATFQDISKRKESENQIKNLAFYDPLTQLPNRRLLLDRLQQALVLSHRTRHYGALLFIDLDNFKTLNDTLGHDTGDLLLIEVGKRIKNSIREDDTVARFGGDEFLVMLEMLDEHPQEAAIQAEAVSAKILGKLNRPFQMGNHEYFSTPSIGITLFRDLSDSTDELLKRADLAMYKAKASGRNAMRFFDPTMQAEVDARVAVESALRQAIVRKEFELYYQFIVDDQGHPIGVEALARWNHPVRGLLSPLFFIPVAEESSLIIALGQHLLESACRQLVAWQDHPLTRHLTIAVNVSARQFRQQDFESEVKRALRESGALPHLLKLELTESMLVHDIDAVVNKMTGLKSLGVSFSLDDFGTGYSSLSYLKRLPFDQLKIDRSFVADVLSDENDAAICRAVIALGKSLSVKVLAEGIETLEQWDLLRKTGCDEAQGFYFCRPMPADEVQPWLQHQAK